MMEEPNSLQELSQSKTWKEATDGSKCSYREDTNKNINSDVS